MLIRDVHPVVWDTLQRRQSIILADSMPGFFTIPIDRILSINKATMAIDNTDYHFSLGRANSDKTGLIVVAVTKVEPEGNIFVNSCFITESQIIQALNNQEQPSQDRSPFSDYNDNVAELIRMAYTELTNRMAQSNGVANQYSSYRFVPPYWQKLLSGLNQFKDVDGLSNQPVPHKVPLDAMWNVQNRIGQKDQFSKPAAFGPASVPPTQAQNPFLPNQKMVWVPNPHPKDPYRNVPLVTPVNQQAANFQVAFKPKAQPVNVQAQDGVETIEMEPVEPVVKMPKPAPMAQSVISGMLNAILASGNREGIVSSFVNGDGNVYLSYADGSISPPIRAEAADVDIDKMECVMQDPVAPDRMPLPFFQTGRGNYVQNDD